MEIKEISTDNLKKVFEVNVSSLELQDIKKNKVDSIAKNAKVQGFRPGKVPSNILEAQYKDKIMAEVVDAALHKAVDDLYSNHQLKTISSPNISVTEFDIEKGLKATIEVELFPEIKDIDFSKITLDKTLVEINDKEIETSLEQMANYYKSFVDITEDKTAQTGDVVVIDFLGKINNQPFEGGEGKDFPLELGSKMFIPGFEEQLIGSKVNDKINVKVNFPEDYHAKDLAGQPAVFAVTVKKLQTVQKANMDDELAKKSGFDTLDALKSDIKLKYSDHIQRIEKNNLKKELMEVLKQEKDIIIPQTLLEQETKIMWDEFLKHREHMQAHEEKGDFSAHKHSQEEIDIYKKSDEEVKKIHEQKAMERIKIGLLLNDIAIKNNISIKEEDISRVISEEASMYGQDPSLLLSHYKNNAESFKALQNRVLEDNIVSFILSKINYKEKKVDFDSYIKQTAQN